MNSILRYGPVRQFGGVRRLALWLLTLCLLLPGIALAQPENTPAPPAVPAAQEQEPRWEELGPAIEEAMTNHRGDDGFALALLIPILAILFIFGGPVIVLIVIALLYYRARMAKARLQSETVARLLEAGKDVPPELLQPEEVQRGEVNMRRGVTNFALGVAILISLTVLTDFRVGSLGLILIALGAAQLTVWKLADRRRSGRGTD